MIIRTDVNRFSPKPEIEALGDTQTEMRTYEMGSGLAVGRQLQYIPFTSRLYHSRHQRTQAGLRTSVRSSLFRQTVLHDIGQPTSKR